MFPVSPSQLVCALAFAGLWGASEVPGLLVCVYREACGSPLRVGYIQPDLFLFCKGFSGTSSVITLLVGRHRRSKWGSARFIQSDKDSRATPSASATLIFTWHLPSSVFPSRWPGEVHGLCKEVQLVWSRHKGYFGPSPSRITQKSMEREREGGKRQSHSLVEKSPGNIDSRPSAACRLGGCQGPAPQDSGRKLNPEGVSKQSQWVYSCLPCWNRKVSETW